MPPASISSPRCGRSPAHSRAGRARSFPTGIALALPPGSEAQVRPRSGLAVKHGLTVLNAPGTIDADYRGEVQVLLVNLGSEAVAITRGMRIAQMVIATVARAELREVPTLSIRRRAAAAASVRPEVEETNLLSC